MDTYNRSEYIGYLRYLLRGSEKMLEIDDKYQDFVEKMRFLVSFHTQRIENGVGIKEYMVKEIEEITSFLEKEVEENSKIKEKNTIFVI